MTKSIVKEAYVSLEVAKLLKEKGFEIITYMVYDNQGNFDYQNCVCCNVDRMPCLYAPTHQMACAWLREKHHIHANPIKQGNYNDCSDYYTWIVASNGIIHRNQSVADKLSYEDAVEAALKYTLENLL